MATHTGLKQAISFQGVSLSETDTSGHDRMYVSDLIIPAIIRAFDSRGLGYLHNYTLDSRGSSSVHHDANIWAFGSLT